MKVIVEPSFIITLAALFLTNDARHIFFMLFSAFVHEAGHMVTLGIFGVKIKYLRLGFFGGTIITEKKLISYPKEAAVALSGASVNLAFALLFFGIMRLGFSADLFFLFLSNVFYGVFNLLPIVNLDGGNALTAVLAMRCELYDAERVVRAVSKATLILLATASLWLVSASAFNISLFLVTLLFYSEVSVGRDIRFDGAPRKPQRRLNLKG